MADNDDDQMHEVSDAELESMISSNTGDIEDLDDDDSLGSNGTSVDNEVYDDNDSDNDDNDNDDNDNDDNDNDALDYERSSNGSDDDDDSHDDGSHDDDSICLLYTSPSPRD